MWIQKYQLAFPINEEEEDRSCLAVQFAWDWDQFPVAVDGGPNGITIHPTELENVKSFNEEFIPILNKLLEADGFRPAVANRTPNELYIDLDDPTAKVPMMDAFKALHPDVGTLEEFRALGRDAIQQKLREKFGRFYQYHVGLKLINWRDAHGNPCSHHKESLWISHKTFVI